MERDTIENVQSGNGLEWNEDISHDVLPVRVCRVRAVYTSCEGFQTFAPSAPSGGVGKRHVAFLEAWDCWIIIEFYCAINSICTSF
jgi:hypothetical protein